MDAPLIQLDSEYLSITPDTLLLCRDFARRIPSQSPRAQLVVIGGNQLAYRVGDIYLPARGRETHTEFFSRHLRFTLGKPWLMAELAKADADRHALVRWFVNLCAHNKQCAGPDYKLGIPYQSTPIGDGMEWLSVADDVYRLRLAGALRPKLIKRLKNRAEFQGARYECAIAASFIRTGFRIDWQSTGPDKKCEFVATQNLTGESIAVEVKSRRRRGTIHEPGMPADPSTLHADVKHLYAKALEQCPKDKPSAVFIDVNMPPRAPDDTSLLPWENDIKAMMEAFPQPTIAEPSIETCLVFTSFGWHYTGMARAQSKRSLYLFPLYVRRRIKNPNTFAALIRAIETYGDFGPPDPRPFMERVFEPH